MKTLVILLQIVILGSALCYLVHDKGCSARAVKALTVRFAPSIVLFALLMAGYATG